MTNKSSSILLHWMNVHIICDSIAEILIMATNQMLLLGSLWLNESKVSQIKSIDQSDPSKSNETKAQQIPLSSFL
jgi:hypothetical protein